MNCEKFEELVAMYLENELAGQDRRGMDEHLAACGTCRETLAVYRKIESSLVSRRDLVPPGGRTASAVIERLGLRRQRRPLFGWVGVPGLASAGFILLGVALYGVRASVAEFFGRVGEQVAAGHSRAAVQLTDALVRQAGGSDWILLFAYLGVFATIMLAGSWMVLKFVRE